MIADPTKQAQEVIFSSKSYSPKHPDLYFNIHSFISKSETQKHLGLKLDEKLNFKQHLRDKFAIVNGGIGMLTKLINFFPCHSLVFLYQAFIPPHLDYADIIYNKPNNMNICNNIERLQYDAALALTGTIRESSKEKLYQELGFEYLVQKDR